jgi:hypothetical protein
VFAPNVGWLRALTSAAKQRVQGDPRWWSATLKAWKHFSESTTRQVEMRGQLLREHHSLLFSEWRVTRSMRRERMYNTATMRHRQHIAVNISPDFRKQLGGRAWQEWYSIQARLPV